MKKSTAILLCLAATLLFSCKGRQSAQDVANTETEETVMTDTTVAEQGVQACEEPVYDIETTMGTIKVKLYKNTPKHRDNFAKLAESHFYDSLLFHRVINGFMIQGGDPNTRDSSKVELYGQGGPGYTVPAEFRPEYYHKKGALAAARMGDRANPKKASSGSQFYIVQDEMACLHLDGEYTIFGETVAGIDVIDRIASVPVDMYDRPLRDVRILSVKRDPKSESSDAE